MKTLIQWLAGARRIAVAGFMGAAALGTVASAAEAVRVEVVPSTESGGKAPALFGFSGNVWRTPEVWESRVSDRIFASPRLGLTRVSLGDQILEQASDFDDLQRRLDAFPLNDFLKRYKAKGGRVLFILDGVPRWLSSNKSTDTYKGPNQPYFRVSPPQDMQQWTRVVEMVVRHFNGKLGLNAYYEAWNEPNFYYLGSNDQFMKQYYHSVLGARRADPKALIGGPGVSEFMGATTAAARNSDEAQKKRIAHDVLEQRYLFRQFLEYASRTAIPELGLKRLPVDFFSWHAFYFDPTRYYQAVVPHIRDALADTGYPKSTPIINTEWNIADVPPYPEGDVNANEVGAAYVATSLLAMNEAGVDLQSFQMYVDPGVDGYWGGMFTVTGLARADYHAFNLFSMLKGRQVRSTSTDPWVKTAAFVDGDTLYLMVASMVPTQRMRTNTQQLFTYLKNPEFTRSIVKSGAVDQMMKGGGGGGGNLPEPQARMARDIGDASRRQLEGEQSKAQRWKNGIELEIEVGGLHGGARQVKRYLIDSKHSNIYPDLKRAERQLAEQREARMGDVNAKVRGRLEKDAGLDDQESRRLIEDLRSGGGAARGLAKLPEHRKDRVVKVLQDTTREVSGQHNAILDDIEGWPSARLHIEQVVWPARAPVRLHVEPNTVQLFVVPM